MSTSGSAAQFGDYVQPSLGQDFDHYVGQMMVAGSHRAAMQRRGPADDHEVSVSMKPDRARQVAHTGAVVNGFSPGARLYGSGQTYERNRRNTEHKLFDVPKDAEHYDRPIYGYLRHQDDHGSRPYGSVVLDIHPGNRELTTTPGDSLNNVRLPGQRYGYTDQDVERLSTDHRPDDRDPGESYREVQIHDGPIRASEVKRATIFHVEAPLPHSEYEKRLEYGKAESVRETLLELRRAQIPTRVMRHMEYQPTLDERTFGKGKEGWVDAEAYAPDRPRVRVGKSPRQMYGRRF